MRYQERFCWQTNRVYLSPQGSSHFVLEKFSQRGRNGYLLNPFSVVTPYNRANVSPTNHNMQKNNLIAYADCFAGISGDMFLGALIDAGYPETELRKILDNLALDGYSLTVSRKKDHGIGSTHLEVKDHPDQQFRHLSKILQLLENAQLPEKVLSSSIAVFNELARAEAKVHDIDIEQVHFHEVGAVDTIIDIVGTVAALDYLGIKKLYSSPLPSPRGFVNCAHGRLPLPAPAVCEIFHDVPCYGVEIDKEMVTPTGAALIKVLTSEFGSQPQMRAVATGYGAGSHQFKDRPNLLRIIIGHQEKRDEEEQVMVIETNLDDWNPEFFPHLCNSLLAQGALDVSLTPTLMKKSRPGHCLTILCPVHCGSLLKSILFAETTTIGVRQRIENRHTLPREKVTVETTWGTISAKKVLTPDQERIYPEYEECKKIAEMQNIPLQQVYDEIRKMSTSK